MKKCAIACVFFFLSFHASAQTYLKCDFNNGIPADFTLIDNDGLTPSKDSESYGFEVGKPWIPLIPKGGTDYAACSTSYYSPSGQSDDWLITPVLSIDEADVTLSWRAMASDKKYRDGYAVYVSTTAGKTIADFDTANPLFTVGEEESNWTGHQVDLSAYKGKTITLAFVNNSNNKSRLFVDDIIVAKKANLFLKTDIPQATNLGGEYPISGTVYTYGSETINGFTVTLTCNGETYTESFADAVVPGKETSFTLQNKIKLEKMTAIPYIIAVSDGTYSYSHSDEITSYQRKIVSEEVTGTWCAWCVRGIVALANLKKTASDYFIGIAVHSGDIMANDYVSKLGGIKGWSGLPTAVLGRTITCDPSEMGSKAKDMLNEDEICSVISLEASVDEEQKNVTVKVNTIFAEYIENANYKLAFSVIENNVHHPENSKYSQNNAAYSGGGSGVMGGYENLPTTISAEDMYFQEVARGFLGEFTGIDGSIPTTIQAMQENVYENTFALPEGIDNINECELVVMLVDGADKHQVNAEVVKLSSTSGIRLTDSNASQIQRCYSADGHLLSQPQKGINIVKMADGTTKKVVLK